MTDTPIIGMDFGTTNSGMATFDGRAVNVLPLDPSNLNPRVARTALYITNEQSVTVGRAAVDLYFEHNVGRPVKMQKIWVGELEVIADLVYYITDVYVWADALSPGRLFLSIKSGLRDVNYPGTVIGQFYYTLEDLIALYLTVTKARGERLLDRELKQVILGRPVHFADNSQGDRVAEARLLQAAFRAGYETVYLQYEPVAAAYSYALELTGPENALIFDFGGGTLDITVMRLGEGRPRVLATNGIPIAGDIFDQKLVRAKLPRHFGEGSFYGPRHKALTVPQWIYDSFADWQTILQLQSAESRRILREIAQTAQRKYQIEALLALVSGNYGLKMFDIVEEAKRTLSDKHGAPIYLDGPGFSVHEFITRSEFEEIIRGETRVIERHLLDTVSESGLRPDQIDSVIRTGGSALIPAFYEMLGRHFGEANVRTIDTFSSVTAGLGIIGHHLSRGEIDLVPHTPADFAGLPDPTSGQLKVRPVNLGLLQRRIEMDERGSGEAVEESQALVLVDQPLETAINRPGLQAYSIPEGQMVEDVHLQPKLTGSERPLRTALKTAAGTPLLVVTSRYRFFLTSARQLIELTETDLGIESLHPFAPRETVCAVADWSVTREMERLLLVTSTGFARAYPLEALRESIEAPLPFGFDSPPPGIPVWMQGAARRQDMIIVTESGRAIRWSLADVPLAGIQAINCGREASFDRVAAAIALEPDGILTILLADGYARRFQIGWVFTPSRANVKGKVLVARKSAVVALAVSDLIQVITNQRLLTAETSALPLEESARTHRLVKLDAGESITALIESYQV
ncbi:MAG: Hsp70 family protein [Chloroflexota bacterium]